MLAVIVDVCEITGSFVLSARRFLEGGESVAGPQGLDSSTLYVPPTIR
jgi:hypothetical protein